MTEPKPHDVVRCVDAKFHPWLTVGRHYVVRRIPFRGHVVVFNDAGAGQSFANECFRVIDVEGLEAAVRALTAGREAAA